MFRILVAIVFLLSTVLCPWWSTVVLGIIGIALYDLWYIAIIGGLIMDLAFGAPIAALGGLAYVYTALFALLSLIAFFLRRQMIE